MNWINKLIKKNSDSQKTKIKNIPDNLWIRCNSCNSIVFKKDLIKNHMVCTNCAYHFFLDVNSRLSSIFDNEDFIPLSLPASVKDPLKFKDKEKYIDKLKSYKNKTNQSDAIVSAMGKINKVLSIVSVMNFEFLGGSMGSEVGEGIVYSIEEAIKQKCPFIIFTASGGARMQEGMFSLMQMAKTTIAVEKLKEANLPYIVVLCNPTTGGVTASFAMIGDIHIAEKGAVIGFAGARVIEQTIRKTLPQGFQSAEYLLEHGMVDYVCSRKNLKATLGTILDLLIHKHRK
jgi:acetyl-CoA carboxylase carboxyl transferase subunit beta